MSDDLREFIDETEALARAKAARHYSVSEDQLDAKLLPPELEIAGLGGRVVILASVRRAEPVIGPVGEFVRELIAKMGMAEGARIEERESDGEIVVSVRAERLSAMAHDHTGLQAALSHLAERAAQKHVGEDASARVELRGGAPRRGDRDRGRDRGGRRDRGRDGRGEGRGDRDRGRGRRGGRDRDRGRGNSGGRRDAGESAPENPELERLALDSGRSVRETGEPATLDEMSSRDRWIVHNALKEVDGVASESVGEGRMKRVKIFPA